ncbi:MAG: hypothetical protein HKN20_04755 [Gemmatimonadetes bacterium]|nr:hypothetical protein [Gemmatimonadota bacterium]
MLKEFAPVLPKDAICRPDDIEKSVRGFLIGDLTLAQLEGMTAPDLYSIADIGYDYFEEGRYAIAGRIFRGLVKYNPFDPYFQAMTGASFQRQGQPEQAVPHYMSVIELDPYNLHGWTNLGESHIQVGIRYRKNGDQKAAAQSFEDGKRALRRAIGLDTAGTHPAALRARAILALY